MPFNQICLCLYIFLISNAYFNNFERNQTFAGGKLNISIMQKRYEEMIDFVLLLRQ